MEYPHDIICRCGGPVVKKEMSGMFSVECNGCGRKAGPMESILPLYAEWYDMIPARTAFEDVMRSMGHIIMRLADSPSEVKASDLVGISESEVVGRRTINMLNDAGLIRGRYIVDGDEVSMEDAFLAKKDGKDVKVYFRKAFNRDPS